MIEKSDSRLIIDSPFTVKSIVSYGLIVRAIATGRWVVVQRKHSAEFLLFFRGLYRPSHLPWLLLHITAEEAGVIIRSLREEEYYRHFYLELLQLDKTELEYSLVRLRENHQLISSILQKTDLSDNRLLWTWPKGRLQNNCEKESPLQCAEREFLEETEISLPPSRYLSPTFVTEYVKTIGGRLIESRYWIYLIDQEIPLTSPRNHPEVNDRSWVSDTVCRELINPSLFDEVLGQVQEAERSLRSS